MGRHPRWRTHLTLGHVRCRAPLPLVGQPAGACRTNQHGPAVSQSSARGDDEGHRLDWPQCRHLLRPRVRDTRPRLRQSGSRLLERAFESTKDKFATISPLIECQLGVEHSYRLSRPHDCSNIITRSRSPPPSLSRSHSQESPLSDVIYRMNSPRLRGLFLLIDLSNLRLVSSLSRQSMSAYLLSRRGFNILAYGYRSIFNNVYRPSTRSGSTLSDDHHISLARPCGIGSRIQS